MRGLVRRSARLDQPVKDDRDNYNTAANTNQASEQSGAGARSHAQAPAKRCSLCPRQEDEGDLSPARGDREQGGCPGIGLAVLSAEKPEEKSDKGGQHREAGKEGDAGTRNHLGFTAVCVCR